MASIIILVCFVYRYKDNKSVLKKIASSLGARRDLMGRYVINKNGIKYWYSYSFESKNSPPVLTVSVPCKSHGEFILAPEVNFDKMAKKLGFSSELQTGDNDFDDKYYISSDTVDFACIYFQSKQKRDILENIFRTTGFSRIRHNGKSLKIFWPGIDESQLGESLVKETIANLVKLSQNLPDYFPNQESLGIPLLRIKTIVFYSLPSLAFIATVVTAFWVEGYPPLDSPSFIMQSLMFSVPLTIVYIILVGLVIRGRASAHKDFMWIALISVFVFPIFINSMLILVNGLADKNEPVAHTAIVLKQRSVSLKGGTTYYFDVRSWRAGHDIERFRVSKKVYRDIRAGKTEATIITKPGALGFEWLVAKRFNN